MAETTNSLADMLRKMRRLMLRWGASPEDAEDMVQEAFLRLYLYERAHEVKSREALLVSTALNISVDRKRRQDRSPIDESQEDFDRIADSQPPPDEILAAQERLSRANAGLAKLNPRMRRILLARRLDGLSYAAIAEREGLSVSAVEKQVARATLFMMKWVDGW